MSRATRSSRQLLESTVRVNRWRGRRSTWRSMRPNMWCSPWRWTASRPRARGATQCGRTSRFDWIRQGTPPTRSRQTSAGSRYGQSVVARFVVESRSGSRVAQLPMAYELDRTDYEGDKEITTVVSGGKVVTDANGLGTIRAAYSGAAASLVLRVLGKDASGNPFEADAGTDVDPGFTGTWLDVASDKIAYTVGDSAHLNVTSSKSVIGLLSLERGRVHQYRWLQLTKGDNTLAVDITPELAPGFAVVFSYFDAGSYSSESFPIHINNSNRLLKVVLTTDQPTYAKGQTAHVTVTVADSTGAPVAANLLADGYDARMSSYKLVDQSSIAGAFLTPTPVMTNGTSSLVGIGYMGGGCGGGGDNVVTDAPYSGHTARWAPDLTTDATGHHPY